MTGDQPPVPDFSVEQLGDRHSREYEVTVDLESLPGDETELVHTARTLEDALAESSRAVQSIRRYGGVNDDQQTRGQQAATILEDVSGVVKAEYHDLSKEVWITTTTFDTDSWSELVFFAGLEESWWYLDHHRDHGIVLEIEYSVRPHAPPFPDDAWEEMTERLHEKEPLETSDATLPAELYHEYAGEREVVTNPSIMDGQPRIAGTEALAYHVYYLSQTHDDLMDTIQRVYPRLDEKDVDVALAYARNHLNEAEAYIDELAEVNETLRDALGTDESVEE